MFQAPGGAAGSSRGAGSGSQTPPPSEAVGKGKAKAPPPAKPDAQGLFPKAMPKAKAKVSPGGAAGSPRGTGSDSLPTRDIGWFNSSERQRHLDRSRVIFDEVTKMKGKAHTRRHEALVGLHKILADRRAMVLAAAGGSDTAEGLPRETVGSVAASLAAETEATNDLLDQRAYEPSTG
eukprot:14999496-Heterocapsa_arctica.AAC.1